MLIKLFFEKKFGDPMIMPYICIEYSVRCVYSDATGFGLFLNIAQRFLL